MRRVLLTSVATTALVAGLGIAAAQQDERRRGDQPAAQQSQQAPRGGSTVKEWPGARTQEPQQQGPARAKPERSTTGQSSDRPADQPRMQRGQGDTRERSTTGQSSPADQPRMQRGQGDARERSTAGQASPADQPRMQRERTGEDRGRTTTRERTTTGQSSGEVTREAPRRGETRQLDRTQERGSRIERRQETRQESTRQDSTARGSATMSDEQRTRVSTRFSQSIDRMNVRPLSRSQVSVSIGATVPRSVRAYTVPRDIVAIYPQFRGHRFVVVDDDIVIVEPGSYRVVSVLPRSGEQRAARSFARETTGIAPAGSGIRLSPQDREVIRTVVLREPACRLEQRVDFVLFIPLPRTVEVCELPQQVVSEAPELRRYRYVVQGDEIGLIDPDDNRVVEVIR
jgi:uncharacterized protein DUF1236